MNSATPKKRYIASSSSDPRSNAKKPTTVATQIGQIFTPDLIAQKMAATLLKGRDTRPLRILDPCVGPSTFPRAFNSLQLLHRDDHVTMIDVDEEMISFSKSWAKKEGIGASACLGDFVSMDLEVKYDCAILNPPYIRQEWIEKKQQYIKLFRDRYSLAVPGTSNLYVYFLVNSIKHLKPGGQLACIVYDSWQSTQFGRWLSHFLKAECSSIKFEAAPEHPFDGRLIDATIIYATKGELQASSSVLLKPSAEPAWDFQTPLSGIDGFCSVNDSFVTKRGLRLKQADFFLCDPETAARCKATPFLKKINRVAGYVAPDDHQEAALLLREEKDNAQVRRELLRRIKKAELSPEENISILTWYRERPDSWMLHREAPYADIVFNYYMRNRPKHILNPQRAYSDNFYGLMPRGNVPSVAWLAVLNSTAVCTEILARSRNQGSGLAKIQLFEYRDAQVPDLRHCQKKDLNAFSKLGRRLVEAPGRVTETIQRIDEFIAAVFADKRLAKKHLFDIFREADLKAKKPKAGGSECRG